MGLVCWEEMVPAFATGWGKFFYTARLIVKSSQNFLKFYNLFKSEQVALCHVTKSRSDQACQRFGWHTRLRFPSRVEWERRDKECIENASW